MASDFLVFLGLFARGFERGQSLAVHFFFLPKVSLRNASCLLPYFPTFCGSLFLCHKRLFTCKSLPLFKRACRGTFFGRNDTWKCHQKQFGKERKKSCCARNCHQKIAKKVWIRTRFYLAQLFSARFCQSCFWISRQIIFSHFAIFGGNEKKIIFYLDMYKQVLARQPMSMSQVAPKDILGKQKVFQEKIIGGFRGSTIPKYGWKTLQLRKVIKSFI